MVNSTSVANELAASKVVAILRGVSVTEIIPVAQSLYDAGIKFIEVPLTDPQALACIKTLKPTMPADCFIGAGTVVTTTQLNDVLCLGVDFALAPNTDPEIIKLACKNSLLFVPGVATATEAFVAVQSGATWLKLFPSHSYSTTHIKSLKAVLPKHVKFMAVGGIDVSNAKHWLNDGADGIGVGKDLYKSGDNANQVEEKAKAFDALIS